ncbi:transposase [Streptomyces sp. NBC_01275]|uniref:transposase n=1 Tax=Streptomyces sp. NBC_01275 TaxID=2903807 RepID=UPI002256F7B2|nr:transposase [Streptomyces sp. NBC_01275]MCX4765951.1 transposase [Streptomyces sp. NBC_01275]
MPCTTSGWDAGKKVGGRKRHLAVDALGLLLLVVLVTAASVQDRDADVPLLSRLLERLVQLALARCLGHLAPGHMPGVVAAVLLDDGHEPAADGPVFMGPEAVEKVGLVIAVNLQQEPRAVGVTQVWCTQVDSDPVTALQHVVGHILRVSTVSDNRVGCRSRAGRWRCLRRRATPPPERTVCLRAPVALGRDQFRGVA